MALRTERQSARMSKINNGGLHQYGAEPFERQQFGTPGVERDNCSFALRCHTPCLPLLLLLSSDILILSTVQYVVSNLFFIVVTPLLYPTSSILTTMTFSGSNTSLPSMNSLTVLYPCVNPYVSFTFFYMTNFPF